MKTWFAVCGLGWLLVLGAARADAPDAGAPADAATDADDAGQAPPVPDGPPGSPGNTLLPPTKPSTRWPAQPPLRVPNEPGTQYRMSTTPPPVGSCLGGSCAAPARPQPRLPPNLCFNGVCAQDPSLAEYARSRPMEPPGLASERQHVPRRERFAYTGALLGVVSAGLALGGAIAIAAVDDVHSERVTRGLEFGVTAVGVPLVALSAWLARRESGFAGYRGLQTLGWLSYAVAVSDGAYLWSDAFQHQQGTKLLTVAAGAFAALAFLPHALDAYTAARSIRTKRFARHLTTSARGFVYRF